MVRAAQSRVVVMTPFFDSTGAAWLQELLSYVSPGVERALILRSLEDNTRKDYPFGFDAISPWLKAEGIWVGAPQVCLTLRNRRESRSLKNVEIGPLASQCRIYSA